MSGVKRMKNEQQWLIPNAQLTGAVSFLEDGGVRFAVDDDSAGSVEIEFEMEGTGKRASYPLVPDQFRRWQLTLYDIPAGMHLMNWYFDGKERICATAPIISHGNQLRNYIKVTR